MYKEREREREREREEIFKERDACEVNNILAFCLLSVCVCVCVGGGI